MPTHLKWLIALVAGCCGGPAIADDSPNTTSAPADAVAPSSTDKPLLFYLALRGGVIRTSTRGHEQKTLVPIESAGVGPDGIAIDPQAGHIYWTTMGKVSADDGTIMRADLDGRNVKVIVPSGGTFTPKQLKLDVTKRKIYWSDREGMRVMRANFDGSSVETLVVAGSGDADRKDASRWCVGIAVDTQGGKLYWTQKGGDNASKGTIKRANLEMPAGATASNRKDIETVFANLPEPIDLDIDGDTRLLYWTDRGDNTISRAPLDPPAKFDPATRTDREIIVRNVGEAIGIVLDQRRDRLYYTSLGGVVGTATLGGRKSRLLLTGQGALTGIALLED